MTHLHTSNTNYGQKKGQKSNWQFDPQPLKVVNRPNFLACKWHATYCWIFFDKGYNFAWDLISIGGLYAKLWAPKFTGVQVVGISGLPFWSPETKWHLGVSPMATHRIYYRGNVMASPKSMVNLVSPCLPVACPCNKVVQLRTNQLVVWSVQVCVSDWTAYQSS